MSVTSHLLMHLMFTFEISLSSGHGITLTYIDDLYNTVQLLHFLLQSFIQSFLTSARSKMTW